MTYRNPTSWSEFRIRNMKPISELRNAHLGLPCYIIGMGPSLLRLRPEHLMEPTAVIIALYESVLIVEHWNLPNPLYSMQKDNITGLPERAPLLVHKEESARQQFTYEPCYVFDVAADFKRPWFLNSGVASSYIAHLFGVGYIEIFCFDRTVHEDRRRAAIVDGNLILDETPDNQLSNVMGEVHQLAEERGVKVEWRTP